MQCGDWGRKKVKIKLHFLTGATTIKDTVDFLGWFLCYKAVELCGEIPSYCSLCFPSLSQPWSSPEASIFTLGMKFSFRNWKYFVTFFFFFNLSIKQFYLFSLENYAAVGPIFICLAYFFPTDCRISTFYIKNESSEPWNEPQSWGRLSAGNVLHRELG